jgi:PAS domain S-box-containing protein
METPDLSRPPCDADPQPSGPRVDRERVLQGIYEAVIESATDLVWSVDLQLRILTFNQALARHLRRHYGTEIAAGQLASELLPPHRLARWEALVRQCLEGGPFSVDYQLEDGRTLSLAFNHIVQAGVTVGISVFGKDITASIRAAEALRDSARRLELATSSGRLGVWELNLADGTQIWNDRMYEIYGLAPQASHPDHAYWCRHIVHPDDLQATDAVIQEALAGARPYDIQFRVVRPDRKIRYVKSNAILVRDAQGRPVRVIGMNRDQTREVEAETERRRLLMDLQHADKMESLGSLAGGVAHDINNVLAAIMGMASVLRETTPDEAFRATALDTITLACTRGRDVVRSLLHFSRRNLESVAPVDLNILAKEMVQLLARSTLDRVQLTTDFQEPLGLLLGDAGALSHALINLCANAVDAMGGGGGGRMLVRTRNLDGGRVQIEVEDTGSGMTPEVFEKAIHPFFTTKEPGKGTGLGLSMVYSTVKAHRGEMVIQSQPGQGTCVRLSFPVAAAEAWAGGGPGHPGGLGDPQGALGDLGGLRVLLADPDELIRCSTLALLDALGCASTAASSGAEGLAFLAAGARPQVIILDLNPWGQGGAETLAGLRALRPEVPILLATGRVDPELQALVQPFPRVLLLAKPFSLRELRQALHQVLEG